MSPGEPTCVIARRSRSNPEIVVKPPSWIASAAPRNDRFFQDVVFIEKLQNIVIKKNHPNIDSVDALLPQTQCGLCDYAGCRPYAEAIINDHEHIDRCPPGGVKTLRELGQLLNIDPEPYVPEMQQKAKPTLLAVIREEECIGCTKCIQPCPVDAIIGASKQMHIVITDACTGCELCVEPCPMDCIDMIPIPERNETQQKIMANQSRERYQKHNARLVRDKQENRSKHQDAKLTHSKKGTIAARKAAIEAALQRVNAKKSQTNHESRKKTKNL